MARKTTTSRTRRRSNRCRWCKKPLDKGKHRSISESLCFRMHETEIRSAHRPKVKTLSDAYDSNGKLKPEFQGTDMEEKLLKRQARKAVNAALIEGNGYKSPRSLNYILDQGFVWAQINKRYPWQVVVLDGGKRRGVKVNDLWEAVEKHKKLKEKYRHVYIISLARSYDIPSEWRFKKDRLKKKVKWCPRCVDFRIFHKVEPPEEFYALKKVEKWSDKRREYVFEWVERKVLLIECTVCGCNNRDPVYRRSNQPWELRHVKQGKSRVKPRKGAPSKNQGKRKKGRR